MAEIIRFQKKRSERDEAIDRLSRKLVGHLSMWFFDRGVFDIVPVHRYVDSMRSNMLRDGVDYDPQVLDQLAEDPKHFKRIEASLTALLIREGTLPEDFR